MAADTELVEITVNEAGNQTPVLDPIGSQVVSEGGSLNFTVTATDPDSTIPSLSAIDVPTNGSFLDNGDGTGDFTFNPDSTQAASYLVRFVASDGVAADTEAVTITVTNSNVAPSIDPIGPQTVDETFTLAFTVTADDFDGTIPSLSAENLPLNSSFQDNSDGTGDFQFTPATDQSGNYTVRFIAFDGALADTEDVEITVNDLGTGAKPSAITDLNAEVSGESVRLTWSEVTTDTTGAVTLIDHYVVFRGTKAYFDLNDADSIGTAPTGTGEFFDSDLLGADVVGDVNTNYFYIVKAVDPLGNESNISNRVGEYDYPVYTSPTTDYTLVALPFENSGITDAAALAISLGGTANINTVNDYIESSQSYQAYFAAGFGVNFPVSAGSIFQVNARQAFTWSIAGQVPDSGSMSYQVVTTPTTNYSQIMIPFEYEDIMTQASDIVDNVPGLLNTVNNFIPSSQSYQSWFSAGFGVNFEVKAGRVYQANGALDGTFPAP